MWCQLVAKYNYDKIGRIFYWKEIFLNLKTGRRVTTKRALTFIFGLILVSIITKNLVWYLNPPFRLYQVGYDYDYRKVNYLQFLIFFLIPVLSAIFLYRVDFKFLDGFYDKATRMFKRLLYAGIEKKETVLSFAIVFFWIFSLMENVFYIHLVENPKPFNGPFDSYHEGEKIGFLYTFLSSDKVFNAVFMHGYFLEVLTSYLLYLVVPENHVVMGFRFLFTLQNLLAWFGVIWVIWEIVNFSSEKENKDLLKLKFIFFSIVFVVSIGSFTALSYQQGFIFLQLGLVFRFFRKLTNSDPSVKFILTASFFIGFSVPLGLLYSTKYGLAFTAIFFLILLLIFFHERHKLFFLGSTLGVVFSGTVLCLMLGWEQILEIGRNFIYWLEFFSPRFSQPFLSDANEHYLWILQLLIGILIICGVQLVINFRQSKNFQSFIRENTCTIILLFLSILVLRIALDISDKRHFRAITPSSLLLLFVLSEGWLRKINTLKAFIIQSYTPYKTTWVIVLVLIIFININPKVAFRHVKPYWKHVSASDDDLLAKKGYDYLKAVNEMRPEVKDMECFYTLTSENYWYYYFKKPSCSRHQILLWAITKKSSNEIIDALREKQPKLILFSNYRSNRDFVTAHSHNEVYNFVYKNYKPYKLIGNHWFWKRVPRGMATARIAKLDVESSITSIAYDNLKGFVDLGGAINSKKIYNIDGVFVTSVNQVTPMAIAVNDKNLTIKSGYIETLWSLKIPMVNISPEVKKFQLWGYSSARHEKIKIGGEFLIDHSKINIKSNYAMFFSKANY
jgi:hypothetical protein